MELKLLKEPLAPHPWVTDVTNQWFLSSLSWKKIFFSISRLVKYVSQEQSGPLSVHSKTNGECQLMEPKPIVELHAF